MSGLSTAKAISQSVGDEEACRALLLQTLSYGTDYDVWPKAEDLTKRTEEAASVLVQAWKSTPALQSLLVDALWAVGSLSHEENEALIRIIRDLVVQAPDRQDFWIALQATLDPSLLEAAHLLPTGGKEVLLKKVRKFNTETHYRQQKFNLLQEESEGYAKLLTLLMSSPLPPDVSSRILDCIGTFELDPNRVLDLLLDLLESRLDGKPIHTENVEQILKLIQSFSVDKIPHLVGFKIKSASDVPKSLYATVVFLAKKGLLDIQALKPHLPSLSEVDKAYELFEKCERQRIQAMGRIRLNADDGKQEDPELMQDVQKLNEATAALEKNALIGLVQVLLQQKEWELANMLLPTWTQVCTLLPSSIGHTLCDFVSERIQSVYRANVPAPLGRSLETQSTSDSGLVLPESASLCEVVDAISEPLEGIMESACIESRPILYCQLCRLLRALLKTEGSTEKLKASTYSVLRMLVSALSLFPPNPAISADLWSLLSLLPYQTRYHLYRDWRGGGLEKAGLSSKPLFQVKCEMQAGKAARYALKRLSKDNIRDMGRQVSKVTHSNPLVVFSTILNQVESYDNLIEMMVEAVRFVTPLSLDVLGYCILSRLDGTSDSGDRSRMKGDGVNVSQWLSSLESFTGAFYKKCPQVEFRGILWYLLGRLKEGHVFELGMLRTLLKTAGGYGFADYSPVASLAATQLEGRAGSQLLKRETFAFGVVEHINFRASRRVRSVLQEDNLGVMILLMLAQLRAKIIFDNSGKHPKPVKLIGNVFDSCQVIMSMLLEFLTDTTDEALENVDGKISATAIRLYAESLPSLGELHSKYGLDTQSAWMLCRPISRAAVVEDVGEKEKGNGQITDAVQSYLPTGGNMTEVYLGMLPERAWADITPDLFELFYSHSLYDICCPENSYESEIARLKKDGERLTQRQKGSSGPSMITAPFGKADEMELERVRRVTALLTSDMSLQKKRNEKMANAFQSRKADCFPSGEDSMNAVSAFLVYCIYPRCMATPDDAMFCAQFVSLLHQNETPGFSTMQYIDGIVDVVAGALYCVTEGEAANMAILLLETWKMVSRWRYDEDAFATEVAEKPGSSFMLDGNPVSVTYEQYALLYNKWHAKLGAVFLGCLNSSEYMNTRACLLVLTRIVDVFPTRPGLGQRLLDALAPLQVESYPLPDIKTTAQAYGMLLLKARDEGVWKEEDAAVAEARVKKEEAALAERQKKADERFEEMKLENEKISEELGDGGRGRDDRRRAPMIGSVEARSRQGSPLRASAPSFEPPKGGRPTSSRSAAENDTSSRHRRGADDGRGRERERGDSGDRGVESSRRSSRDRDASTRRGGRDDSDRGRRGDDRRGDRDKPAGLEGRWERGLDPKSATRPPAAGKRPRSPGGEEQVSKRGRSDRDGDGGPRPMQGRPSKDGDSHRDVGSRDGPGARRNSPREPPRGLAPSRRSERRGPARR